MKARDGTRYGMLFLKGPSGKYYLSLSDRSVSKRIYFEVNNPEILEAISFLYE